MLNRLVTIAKVYFSAFFKRIPEHNMKIYPLKVIIFLNTKMIFKFCLLKSKRNKLIYLSPHKETKVALNICVIERHHKTFRI